MLDWTGDACDYCIIGGGWTPESSGHILKKDQPREEEDLAKLSVSIIASRIDSNHMTVDMNLVPMMQAKGRTSHKGENVMELTGQVMKSFCSSGPPPLSIAFDNGGANAALNHALLGLMSNEELSQYTFFKTCAVRDFQHIKMFPFSVLRTAPVMSWGPS